MIGKFASIWGEVSSEFLDLNRISRVALAVSLMIPKFAPGTSRMLWRTSESGH
jgi:hypothetical protein